MTGKLNPNKKLTMTTYMPQKFDFSTTNADAFKDFKVIPVADRAHKYAPNRDPVQSKTMPAHFKTTNMKELRVHEIRQPLVDAIPYP